MAEEKALVLKKQESKEMKHIFEFYYIEDGELMTKGTIEGYSDEDEIKEMLEVLLESFLRGA